MIITAFAPPHFFAQTHIFSVSLSSFSLSPIYTAVINIVIRLRLREGACVRREGRRCEKTKAAIKKPIAAPAWPRYGTRPPLGYLCVLLAVRAAGGRFRRRKIDF